MIPIALIVWFLIYTVSAKGVFKSDSLEMAVRMELNDFEGELTAKELGEVKKLKVRGENIDSLIGIEHLTNLKELDLRDNHIKDITPINKLKKLEKLNLRGNQVTDLNPLIGLTSLRKLNIRENNVQDIQALSELVNLENLNMRENRVSDVSPLADLKHLTKRLYISSNPLEDVRVLDAIYDDIEETDFTIHSDPVEFSINGGFYEDPQYISLSHPDERATIYYTLDGSEPTVNDYKYEEPIEVVDRTDEDNRLSDIPLNNRDDFLAWKKPKGSVFKGTVIRAIAIEEDVTSDVATETYFIGANDRYDVPVISIATDKENFFDEEDGLFMGDNPLERGKDWERPIHLEYFDEEGQLGLSQNLGARIHGSSTREAPVKSLRLYARSDYELTTNTMNYPFFKDKDIANHDRLLLRHRGTSFKDGFQVDLVKDVMDLDFQYNEPAVVFINGEYWGVFNIRDRFDDNYIKNHYGIKEIDFLTNIDEVKYGDDKAYKKLYSLFKENERDLTDDVYAEIDDMMDIDNFMDYHIFQTYTMNVDQPGKNVNFWRSKTINPDNLKEDGRFRWMVYDLDMGYGSYGGLRIDGFIHNTSQMEQGADTVLSGKEMAELYDTLPDFAPATLSTGPEATLPLRAMLTNDKFREHFISRTADLLNTNFHPDYAKSLIKKYENKYEPLAEENARKIGEDDDAFQENIDKLIEFAEERPELMRAHAIHYFQEVSGIHDLTMKSDLSEGVIQANSIVLDDSLPSIQSEGVYSWQGTYFDGVPVTLRAKPKDGYTFVGWSGDVESDEETVEVTLTKDTEIEAVFEKK